MESLSPHPFQRGNTARRIEIASGVIEGDNVSEETLNRSTDSSRRGSQSSIPSTSSRSSSTVRFAEEPPSTPGRRSIGSRTRSTESLSTLTGNEDVHSSSSRPTTPKEKKQKIKKSKIVPEGILIGPPRSNSPSAGSITPKSTASSTSGDLSQSSHSQVISSSETNNNTRARKLWKEGITTVVAANRFKNGAEHWRAMQSSVLGGDLSPSFSVHTPSTTTTTSTTTTPVGVDDTGKGNKLLSGGGGGGGGGGVRISSLKRSASTTFISSGSSTPSSTPRPPMTRGGSLKRELSVSGGTSTPVVGILKKTPSNKDVTFSNSGGGGGVTRTSSSNEEIVRVAALEKNPRTVKKTAPLWRWALGLVKEENRIKKANTKKYEAMRTKIVNERRKSRAAYLLRPRSESYENPGEILPYLYVGGQQDAEDLAKLKLMGITHILNAAASLDSVFANQFVYLRSELDDDEDEDVVASFEEAFRHIEDAKTSGGAVLVHCVAGMSRSVAIVIAWLIHGENVSLLNALNMVRSRRPVALPNVGFRLALAHFEVKTLGYSSVLDAKDDPAWNFEALRTKTLFPKGNQRKGPSRETMTSAECCVII
jgi:protein-tyrosine phosphatase